MSKNIKENNMFKLNLGVGRHTIPKCIIDNRSRFYSLYVHFCIKL